MSKCSSKKSKRRSKAVPALGITGLSLSLASGAIASTGEAMGVPSSQPHELFLGEEEIFDSSLSTFYTFDKENGQASLAQQLKLARGGGCGGCGGGGGCGGHGGCGGGGGGGGGCGGGGCAAGARGCAGGGGCAGGVHVGCAGGARVACAGGVRGGGCAGVRVHCAGGFHVHCRCAFFRRCFGCGCGGCGGGWGCGTCWIWTPTWGWINTCWGESTPPTEVASVASEPIAQTAEVAVKSEGNIDGRTK
jgi:hypothetical protein